VATGVSSFRSHPGLRFLQRFLFGEDCAVVGSPGDDPFTFGKMVTYLREFELRFQATGQNDFGSWRSYLEIPPEG
jgi:hypothetical protein